jgi:site-specific recombinase XerD
MTYAQSLPTFTVEFAQLNDLVKQLRQLGAKFNARTDRATLKSDTLGYGNYHYRANYGHRLSGTSVYRLVEKVALATGITKKLSPHRIRHSGITAALNATGGDVRRVQKLSRHANLNTLTIYDDNRQNVQGEISDLLADLV